MSIKKLVSFGEAIQGIKVGKKMAREGWNGSGMFIYYVPENSYPTTTGVAKEIAVDGLVAYRAYIALKTADGSVATWSPSGSDALAEDWYELMELPKEKTWFDRLVIERDELEDKFYKLSAALDGGKVPASQVEVLSVQKKAMMEYLEVLNKRISESKK